MENNPRSVELGKVQKIVLLVVALLLSAFIFVVRGGLSPSQPLDQLARRSIPPDIALSNGRPTILEFYADWCEICQKMAPTMLDLETKLGNKIDFVLLNVDNDRWFSFVDKYEVNGVPQFNFFDERGEMQGEFVGFLDPNEISKLSHALLNEVGFSKEDLSHNQTSDKESFSELNSGPGYKIINPRSHG
ncbi:MULTISPECIES: thioredoxin domain-containing protein [Prochlorococcus]|uniref:thioredoxin domain-containing protein n=1 Tax=Prochlorococcus TaxID=1218 RepID=UPI000533B5E3|nr:MULTISPECIES: thioredoxin domain-containing protein [Prochlorococcus]KGG13123.1 thioredoxin-like protein TxlA [Prochlorococcus sp. MIT 0601]